MKSNKESALKSLAKRPKLIAGIEKGTEFHKLKTVGQVSGGFIRQLMWAGIVEKNEDGIVKFVKGFKKSSLPSLEPEERTSKKGPKKGPKSGHLEGPTTKDSQKGKGKTRGGKKQAQKDLQSDDEGHSKKALKKGTKGEETGPDSSTLSHKEQRQAAKAERLRIRAERKAIKLKNKAEKQEAGKPGPVTKKAKGKLLRPVKSFPANHKIDLEYQDGFWWASDKEGRYRIATTNIKFE